MVKLRNRFAAGLVAALLAVSMLTACGGSGTPDVPGSGEGGKPSTGQGIGTGSGDSTGGDNKGDSSDPKEDEPSVKPAGKYRFQKYIATKNYPNGAHTSEFEVMKGSAGSIGYITTYATDGIRYYEKEQYPSGDSCVNLLDTKNKKFYQIYEVDPYGMTVTDDSSAIEDCGGVEKLASIIDDNLMQLMSTLAQPSYANYHPIQITTELVNNELCYCETAPIDNYPEKAGTTFCFAPDDTEGKNLLYIINFYQNSKMIYNVRSCTNKVDDAKMLQLPEGYPLITRDKDGRIIELGTTPKDNYPN